MTSLDSKRRQDHRKGWNLSSNQVVIALITGLFTVIAAFVTGAFKGNVIGLAPAPSVTVTTTQTATVTASPRAQSTQASPAVQNQPNPQPTNSAVPVLAPKNQPGWTLAWHDTEAIGPQGVIIARTGPQVGNGSNFDLQYIPGSGAGWITSGTSGDFGYWDNNYRPGPATINGIVVSGDDNTEPGGKQARLGDRLIYENSEDNIVAYMQVTSTPAGDVVTDMWLWNKL